MKFINAQSEFSREGFHVRAVWWYLGSLLILILGILLAARHYPGGFDWPYTVASALASRKYNPDGSFWFSSSFIISMGLLWPYASSLKNTLCPAPSVAGNFAIRALRLGMICGALVAAERLFIHHISDLVYKAHEILALLFFLGLYIGVFTLLIQVMRRHRIYILPALVVASPLLAIGITQLWLYFDQRDLGWVDASWREKGIPIWLSFAFWQWLAIGCLWLCLGFLSFIRIEVKQN